MVEDIQQGAVLKALVGVEGNYGKRPEIESGPDADASCAVEEVLVVESYGNHVNGVGEFARSQAGYPENALLDRLHTSFGPVRTLAEGAERDAVSQALHDFVEYVKIFGDFRQLVPLAGNGKYSQIRAIRASGLLAGVGHLGKEVYGEHSQGHGPGDGLSESESQQEGQQR